MDTWRKRTVFIVGVIFSFIIIVGQVVAEERIRLATTTSTDNTGLLQVILPPFEKMCNLTVDVIAVGTGKAIKLGEDGNVDLILVHAPEAEEAFVEGGYGINRREVMHNDFVLLGPTSDPAQIAGEKHIGRAFTRIARTGSLFVSRGDDSGTHKKEKEIWKMAGINPDGAWYLEAGQGMGTVLQMAHEKLAYTISDRGTYLAYRPKVDLIIMSEGDPSLYNPYGVIAVNPARHPQVKYVKAMALIGWLTSPECQKLIGNFTKEGEVLFHPDAIRIK